MSYYSEVIKDCPDTLYMCDGDFLDSSGHGVTAGIVGSPDYTAVPLAAGASHSMRMASGTYWAVPFPYLETGNERHPFSLETWFYPVAATSILLTHQYDYQDGLAWYSGSVWFAIRLSGGTYVRTQYTPESTRNMHIVGVYTGERLELWVNGVLRDSVELSDAQRADTFYTQPLPGYLYGGNTASLQQGVATYYRALTPLQIRNHYNAGKSTLTNEQASGMFSGVRERISNVTANLFLDKQYNTKSEWMEGFGSAIITDSISSPIDTTGAYVAGAWDVGIPLDHGGTSVEGVTLNWDAKGVVVVYSSMDGITWDVATPGLRIASVTPGFNATGKTLRLRVTFAGGSYGEVFALDVRGYKTNTVTSATRPITLPAYSLLNDENQVLDYDSFTGATVSGTLTIGATSDDQEYRTISFWYRLYTGTITTNVTPTTFYENNVARAYRAIVGEWCHAVLIIPVKSDALTLAMNGSIANLTLYDTALSAAQVDSIYKSFTGIPSTSVDASGTVGISTPTVAMYANDWSITGAG